MADAASMPPITAVPMIRRDTPPAPEAMARRQPFVHDPKRADALADLHRPDLDRVLFSHDSHLVAALELCHRALGNEESALLRRCDRPHTGELAGAKDTSRIREQSLQPQCASPYIHLAVR